jgi:hypothetical protein
MRTLVILRSMAVALVFFSLSWPSFGLTPDRPGPSAPQPPAKHQGFFDYALGNINPRGNDYGATLESRRNAVVGNTIDDLYFWSNVVTLLMLSGLVGIVLLQWRATDKREAIAASLIAQLWNGRVSDRIEIERRTAQFDQLVEAHNADVEKTLSQKSTPSEQETEAAGSLTRSVRKLTQSKGAPPESAEKFATTAPDAGAPSLQQSNLLLQRRVEALLSSEQNLKQRLNQTTVLLDQERRRNATLKGA